MQFSYEARTKNGDIQSGWVESSDEKTAIEFLQRNNFVVISIVPEGISVQTLTEKYFPFLYRVKKNELAMLSRQMSILVEAKISIVQSLRAVIEQNENKVLREMILNVASNVEAGMPLSIALSRYPDSFSSYYINLIKSGEVSGDLEGVLTYLAEHLEKEAELESKVKSALIYPSVIVAVFGLVGIVFMVFIVPKITAMFAGTGKELPLITKAIIAVSNILINYWIALIMAAAGIAWLIGYWIRYKNGSEKLDEIKIRLPIFGGLYKKIYITQFAENLSTLISGGVAMIEALKITANVINNTVYRRMIMAAADKVKAGESMSLVFKQNNDLMPPMVVTMISIGEKTGRLDAVLKKVAYFYGREVDGVVANISSLIEPIIILTLGVAAAILVAAILLPIYDIAGA